MNRYFYYLCININIYVILYILKTFFLISLTFAEKYRTLIREILVGKTIETSKSTTKLARMEFSIKLRIICIPQTNVCQHSPLLRDDKFHVYPSFRSLHIPIKIDQRLDKKKYFACWNRYIFFLAILTREL